MNKIVSIEQLIQQVQERDIKVQLSQRELVSLWIMQGLDMLKLHKEHSYTQTNTSELTGISQAQISLYISLASDTRLVTSIIATDKNTKHLERFNQKELKRLTTLNDVDFNQTVDSGMFPKTLKKDKCIELSIEEQIENKQKNIQLLKDEIKTLQIESGVDVDDIFEVPKLIVKPKPQFKKKPVNQIDLKSGEIIASFESLGDASKQTGYSRSSLSKCANSIQKHSHGFKWRYAATILSETKVL